MKKVKTSMSLDYDRLARLKRLAERERRSVSQMVDLALDQLLPVLDATEISVDHLAAEPAQMQLGEEA